MMSTEKPRPRGPTVTQIPGGVGTTKKTDTNIRQMKGTSGMGGMNTRMSIGGIQGIQIHGRVVLMMTLNIPSLVEIGLNGMNVDMFLPLTSSLPPGMYPITPHMIVGPYHSTAGHQKTPHLTTATAYLQPMIDTSNEKPLTGTGVKVEIKGIINFRATPGGILVEGRAGEIRVGRKLHRKRTSQAWMIDHGSQRRHGNPPAVETMNKLVEVASETATPVEM